MSARFPLATKADVSGFDAAQKRYFEVFRSELPKFGRAGETREWVDADSTIVAAFGDMVAECEAFVRRFGVRQADRWIGRGVVASIRQFAPSVDGVASNG